MKKSITVAVMAVIALVAVKAGAVELNGLKAGDVAGLAEAASVPAPEASVREVSVSKAAVPAKISVSPVTENWKGTVLVKFARNADVGAVMHILDSVDLSPAKFSDNGDGYWVRVDIEDSKAPLRVSKLAGFSMVETVQVNRTVYALLAAGPRSGMPKGAAAVHLLRMSSVLASGRLPGGCVVENNDFRPAPHFPMGDDTLNLGISRGGRYMDMLLVGDVQYREDDRSETFRYESVSTQGADWVDRRVKNTLELRVENGAPVSFAMVKYKEASGLFGGTSWKETDSVVCR